MNRKIEMDNDELSYIYDCIGDCIAKEKEEEEDKVVDHQKVYKLERLQNKIFDNLYYN